MMVVQRTPVFDAWVDGLRDRKAKARV